MFIAMDITTYGTIMLILLIVFSIIAAFTRVSKKQYREQWAQQRPNLPLPEKYKFDPNDPDDDKPKMGTSGKVIIVLMVVAVIVFIIIMVSS